jgi:peptide deformylase
MIRSIVQLGDSVLKTPARAIEPADLGGAYVQYLAHDMAETLAKAGGVGLAAPQVGESVRLILAGSFPSAHAPDRPDVPIRTLVNPVIVSASGETESGWEGCLSFPHLRVRVSRHTSIAVEYLTLEGTPTRLEAEGFFARVLQHEIDHLDGILTLDRASTSADVVAAEPPPSSEDR